MDKIDFFGGTHGTFLELMLNLFVYQIEFDQTQSFFNENGACHLKDRNSTYYPVIKQNHYSFNNQKFNPNDRVIEIHCSSSDMLAAITNSFLRAGDKVFDLYNLQVDTINNLRLIPKAQIFLNNLLHQHGAQEHYSKIVIRNYIRPDISKIENVLPAGKNLVPSVVVHWVIRPKFLSSDSSTHGERGGSL
jgi:hypothetical protein